MINIKHYQVKIVWLNIIKCQSFYKWYASMQKTSQDSIKFKQITVILLTKKKLAMTIN